MHYHIVFVGGTFDGLHEGHKTLLSKAFGAGDGVVVGLTSDFFVQKFKSANSKLPIASFVDRKAHLERWLEEKNLASRTRILSIDDPYEPAASEGYDAIIVTEETKARALEINALRSVRLLPPLVLIEVPLVLSQDAAPISSTRIRNGTIDDQGNLIMPEDLRVLLGKPLGTHIDSRDLPQSLLAHQGRYILTVGDITTERVVSLGVIPTLAIIDLHVGRHPYDTLANIPDTLLLYSMEVVSGPGFISWSARKAIAAWALNLHPTLIIVDGEEDLLTLPAIIEAPLGSVLYYGQPALSMYGISNDLGEGVVVVEVTEEKKEQVATILEKFQKK